MELEILTFRCSFHTRTPTYDAKGLPGKSQPSLPSPVSAATASSPDPDEVLQPKDHDHYKLLQTKQTGQ